MALPETSAWVALNVSLAQRKISAEISKSDTSTKNVNNFPHVPLTVSGLKKDAFLDLCEKEVEELKSISTTKKLQFRLTQHESGAFAETATDEIGVSSYVQEDAGTIFIHGANSKALLPEHHYATGSRDTNGDMDGQIGTGKVHIKNNIAENMENISVSVEIKTNKCRGDDIASEWCNFPCDKRIEKKNKNGKVVVDKNNKPVMKDNFCGSVRHKAVNPGRQLYNYMVNNGVLFGLFSSHDQYVGFIRDCKGNLVITHAYNWYETFNAEHVGMSVAQFLVLFCKLAFKKIVPEQLVESGLLVACEGGCKHNKLPNECDVEYQGENFPLSNQSPFTKAAPKGGNTSGNADQVSDHTGGYFGGSTRSTSTSIHDLPRGEYLGSGYTGTTRRTSIGGKLCVIKFADLSKKPDREGMVANESIILQKLKDMWGHGVPTLIDHGRLHENFLCAIATSDEGTSNFVADESFIAQAKDVLRRIHSKGVLHGDIRKENILKNKNGSPVVIDFGMSRLCGNDEGAKVEKNNELNQLERELRYLK